MMVLGYGLTLSIINTVEHNKKEARMPPLLFKIYIKDLYPPPKNHSRSPRFTSIQNLI